MDILESLIYLDDPHLPYYEIVHRFLDFWELAHLNETFQELEWYYLMSIFDSLLFNDTISSILSSLLVAFQSFHLLLSKIIKVLFSFLHLLIFLFSTKAVT